MSDWNSELYLQFKKERTQPAMDLANRIRTYTPKKVVDIGCGHGNSTQVLKTVFPNSDILGIDNSQNMIAKAQKEHPELQFEVRDASDLRSGYDLLFSNACLQWIPDHASLLPKLMGKLNHGGVLAVQVPMNRNEPLYRIADEMTSDSKWQLENCNVAVNGTLTADEYYEVLSGCSSDFQIWETVYYHPMPSHQSLVDWIKGTRLRPYLDALSSDSAAALEHELFQRTVKTYPKRNDGSVLLRFKRLFFIAIK